LIWGTKGPSLRPRCIGVERSHTHMQFNSIGRGGGCAVIHAVGTPCAAYLRWPVLSSVGLVGSS
jgi:hypothetical protein